MLIKKTIVGLSTLLLPLLAVTQTVKLENINLEFTLPGNKWVFIPDRSHPKIKSYVRIENNSEKNSPILTVIVVEGRQFNSAALLAGFLKTGENTTQKKFSQLSPTSDYMSYEQAVLYRGTVKIPAGNPNIPSGNLYGYDAYILCNKTGVYFNLNVPENFSSLYETEFLSILKSIKKPGNASIVPQTSTSTMQTNAGNQRSGNTSDNCNYFPVVNGMKLTYKRNDMTGEHSIVESYTVVKDKTLKSGKVIKGYKINTTVENRNNTIVYYYCDNGSMKMYSEMPAYNTFIKEYEEDYSVLPSDYNKPFYKKTPIWETEKYGSGKYISFTELKDGGAGTEWTDRQVVNSNPVTINSEIVETGLSLTVQGKKYSPVIHVERTVTINYLGEDMELNTQDIYYAKGVGKIKVIEEGNDLLMGNSFTTTQELVSHNLPAQLNNPENKPANEIKKENATKTSIKEQLDESLTGTWKNFRSDRMGGMTLIYRLNPDGTFEYYTGSPVAANLAEKGTWNMNKDTLMLSVKEARGNPYFYLVKSIT